MACILLWSSAVRVHDSHAYREMDVTRERISRILELREILLSIQTGFILGGFGGRTITNLRFADDIDGLAAEEEELANFVERLNKASTAYGMEISAEKTKLMTNNTSGINAEIKVLDRSFRQSQASNTRAQL